jgi:hypothetical protein
LCMSLVLSAPSSQSKLCQITKKPLLFDVWRREAKISLTARFVKFIYIFYYSQ